MPSSTRAQRRRERTTAILNAAMEIIVADGAQALTMRALAKAVGLTPGAVYRYFDGKDAIIGSLAERTLAHYAEALDAQAELARTAEAALPPPLRPLAVQVARIERYWSMSVTEPAGWRLVNLFLVDRNQLITGEAHARAQASLFAQLQYAAALFEQAVAAGALSPGSGLERSLVLLSAVHGNLQYQKLSRTAPISFTPVDTFRAATDSLLRGWGASDAAIAQLRAHLLANGLQAT